MGYNAENSRKIGGFHYGDVRRIKADTLEPINLSLIHIFEELRAVLVSERRVYIAETATYPLENADKAKSERAQLIYNSKTADGEDVYKRQM